jgi:hypothetical protein
MVWLIKDLMVVSGLIPVEFGEQPRSHIRSLAHLCKTSAWRNNSTAYLYEYSLLLYASDLLHTKSKAYSRLVHTQVVLVYHAYVA